MNEKIITALLTILIALSSWTITRTFAISNDIVLVKEKISKVEKQLDEAVWNTLPENSKETKK
jgi:uncharacterized membrane protein SpoIIM required for sporulation